MEPTLMTNDKTSHADMIIAAARELQAHGRTVTRHSLADVTGLKMSIVDDRVKHLTDTGKLLKRERGVYEPVEAFHEPRPIYHAVLPGNVHKIEIGDDVVLTLNPQEARTLGHMLAGAAFAYHANELAYQAIARNNELSRQIVRTGRRLRDSKPQGL